MNDPTKSLIASLIENVAVPFIATAIRAHYNATGQLPSEAQILAALPKDADGSIAIDEAWLDAHPQA